MIPAPIKMDGRYRSLKSLAAEQSVRFRGIADSSEGKAALLFVYENSSYMHFFTTGYFYSLRRAVAYSRAVFQNEDITMNIFKNNKLFPNIRGVMLKEKRITLHMSGKYNTVEMRDGADARIELFFTDHEKTAVINRTQLLDIADVYGPETNDWNGKPVVLYGEEGNWFGKHQWGIRVDHAATKAASKKVKAQKPKKGGGKPESNGKADPVLDSLSDDITDTEMEMIAKMTAEEYNEYRVEMGSQPLTAEELERYSSQFLQPGD